MFNQTTPYDDCYQSESTLIGAILLVTFALPVHVLLMKILYKDCQLTLPHHKVMISLTLSDSLQIFAVCALVLCRGILGMIKNQKAVCLYSQAVILFFIIVTFIVSSFSIVTLSIERYVSCVHALHVHNILTTRRVVSVLVAQWIIGIGLAATTVYIHQTKEPLTMLTNSSIFRKLIVLVVFPSATAIALIQVRLLIFSHSKLATVKPHGAYGTRAEMIDFRKRQLKITFVASIVALAYIACMFPISILYGYEWQHGEITNQFLKQVLIGLGMLNTLADPVIYGLGVKDTRKLMWKNVKQIKDLLLWFLCRAS